MRSKLISLVVVAVSIAPVSVRSESALTPSLSLQCIGDGCCKPGIGSCTGTGGVGTNSIKRVEGASGQSRNSATDQAK